MLRSVKYQHVPFEGSREGSPNCSLFFSLHLESVKGLTFHYVLSPVLEKMSFEGSLRDNWIIKGDL